MWVFAQQSASIWMIVLNILLPLVGPPCLSRLQPKFTAQKEHELWFFAQKGLPSLPFRSLKPQSFIETKTVRFCNLSAKRLQLFRCKHAFSASQLFLSQTRVFFTSCIFPHRAGFFSPQAFFTFPRKMCLSFKIWQIVCGTDQNNLILRNLHQQLCL